MVFNINISIESLEGARRCAAQTTTGHILESVLIDAWVESGKTQLRVFASDSAVIGAYIHYVDDIPALPMQNLRVAVPLPVVVRALALNEENVIEFRLVDGFFSLGGVEFKPMEGIYPELEQYIPAENHTVKQDLPRFNSHLFARAESAFKAFYGKTENSLPFGSLTAFVETDACVFHFGAGHAVVVIVPVSYVRYKYHGFFKG